MLPMKCCTKLSKTSILLIMLIFSQMLSVHAAVEWPWQQVGEQKAKGSSSVATAEPAPKPVVKSTLDKSSGSRSLPLDSGSQQLTASPATTTPAGRTSGLAGSSNTFTIKAPQRNANYEEAVKIQAKLNDLLRVTSEVDRLNRSKVTAVQSMVDKARMNQKILTLLATPRDAAAQIKKTDAEQILLNKKLRGIREDAEKQIALAQSNKDSVLPDVRKTV